MITRKNLIEKLKISPKNLDEILDSLKIRRKARDNFSKDFTNMVVSELNRKKIPFDPSFNYEDFKFCPKSEGVFEKEIEIKEDDILSIKNIKVLYNNNLKAIKFYNALINDAIQNFDLPSSDTVDKKIKLERHNQGLIKDIIAIEKGERILKRLKEDPEQLMFEELKRYV